MPTKLKKILLHICCGVCAGGAIEKLQARGYLVSGYFYNPNIHPYKEYLLRKKEAEKIANLYKIKIIEDDYELNKWKDTCSEFSREKEGGKRCNLCFKLRLEKTYQAAQENNFAGFTSTLTISPHKNSRRIFEIGEEIGGDKFLKIDFKKKDGFKKAVTISKKLNLYRQSYCGCIYSLRDKDKKLEDRK
jgi:predicted adenine nucleotide alpha hydrolase (AANH) superfamily ATPase